MSGQCSLKKKKKTCEPYAFSLPPSPEYKGQQRASLGFNRAGVRNILHSKVLFSEFTHVADYVCTVITWLNRTGTPENGWIRKAVISKMMPTQKDKNCVFSLRRRPSPCCVHMHTQHVQIWIRTLKMLGSGPRQAVVGDGEDGVGQKDTWNTQEERGVKGRVRRGGWERRGGRRIAVTLCPKSQWYLSLTLV